jgi:cytochrome c oxidase subunit 3
MSELRSAHSPAPQFVSAEQQREAATLGMWIFIATEVLLFGSMFLGYAVYRLSAPQAFAAASRHTLLIPGTVNTALLLLSSGTMALAVGHPPERPPKAKVVLLLMTALLGVAFLAVKVFEYQREVADHFLPGRSFQFAPPHAARAEMFFYLYFLMTGIHALHVFIGVVLITVFAFRTSRARTSGNWDTALGLLGLYWHFVDVVWVFLFPLIYLVNRHP